MLLWYREVCVLFLIVRFNYVPFGREGHCCSSSTGPSWTGFVGVGRRGRKMRPNCPLSQRQRRSPRRRDGRLGTFSKGNFIAGKQDHGTSNDRRWQQAFARFQEETSPPFAVSFPASVSVDTLSLGRCPMVVVVVRKKRSRGRWVNRGKSCVPQSIAPCVRRP